MNFEGNSLKINKNTIFGSKNENGFKLDWKSRNREKALEITQKTHEKKLKIALWIPK